MGKKTTSRRGSVAERERLPCDSVETENPTARYRGKNKREKWFTSEALTC